MLELLGQSEGECVGVCRGVCVGVCVGVCLGVCMEGLGKSLGRRRRSVLGEEGNRLRGRGIPEEAGPRGAVFTLTPPLISEKDRETQASIIS